LKRYEESKVRPLEPRKSARHRLPLPADATELRCLNNRQRDKFMRTIIRVAALFSAMTAICCAPTVATESNASTPLIKRAILFGNPSQSAVQLSPNGKWLAWLAPNKGVLNAWIAPLEHPADAKLITHEMSRPIQGLSWAPDSESILYLSDTDGDENFLLYQVRIEGGEPKLLTPFKNSQVRLSKRSSRFKDRILIDINDRDSQWFDTYSLDLTHGTLAKILENTEELKNIFADDNLVPRIATRSRPDGGLDYFLLKEGRIEAKPFKTASLEDAETTAPGPFTYDGKTLYWSDSVGRDKAAIFAQNVQNGTVALVAESPKVDLSTGMIDPKTGKLQAYLEEYLTPDWVALDPSISDDLAFLKVHTNGAFDVTSRTDADDLWTVVDNPINGSGSTYLYRRAGRRLSKLFVNRPDLDGAPFSPMFSREIKTRDGMTLVSYLTLPLGSDNAHPGVPDHPLPMVLLVHGGPWSRDHYGPDVTHLWLANRGYAVLSVNFRGSAGFGKQFMSAGDRQWGRKMQDDLIDSVNWAVANKVAAPHKVAIVGGSYGGYAALAGLTFTPRVFACGVDIVGPSNLQTLLATLPPYWTAERAVAYKRIGDPTTIDGRLMLQEQSPLTKVSAIVKPLLIGQGMNDPRVNQSESDQIVRAMVAKQIPVTYVQFPDEGHGFSRPDNSIAFNAVVEQFLGKCLGGRSEPIGDSIKASNAKVPYGGKFVPGLNEAIESRKN
jgi:dipeptidyl aminopeptidase/acylaminoacyl peptidase